VEPPSWTNAIDLGRDTRAFGRGSAGGAATEDPRFLAVFEKTEIQMSPRAGGEAFQIRTNRRKGK